MTFDFCSEPGDVNVPTQIITPEQTHDFSIIFIHGLGQSNLTWKLVVQEAFAPALPSVKWILPQAPSDQPAAYYHGECRPSWFEISELPPTQDPNEDCQQIKNSVSAIEDLILGEVHAGMDPKRIFLVGFSQGAALALIVALSTLYELGGVVSLSGWIPHRARPLLMSTTMPILWCHGLSDDEIPYSYAQEAVAYLRSRLGISTRTLTFKEYEDLEHTIRTDELEDVVSWLSRVLG
ncbi:Phospholipase/carboxylesterase [Pterulicium gracile]|uniref:Acyl-protein thioesterase 1 n=1 Tax=Pterulicium gracile TaxID=1884261 RepID=A0A5C3QPB2_9AGAR|nr:Phospholipase/carboxylesterase [Pterula gracilis]